MLCALLNQQRFSSENRLEYDVPALGDRVFAIGPEDLLDRGWIGEEDERPDPGELRAEGPPEASSTALDERDRSSRQLGGLNSWR
jgi:hypothetical protein